jgi:hypothetical protein
MTDINTLVYIRASVAGPEGYDTDYYDPKANRWVVSLWRDIPDCDETEFLGSRLYRRKHAAIKMAQRLAEQHGIEVIEY